VALEYGGIRVRSGRQTQCRQRDARQTGAEFLQRPAPCDGLSQLFGEFVELIVHNFYFRFVFVCVAMTDGILTVLLTD
jgi:hypothetical protein